MSGRTIQKTISGIPLPALRALHPHFLPYSQLLNPIIYIPIGSNRHRFETNSCCSRCSQLLCMSQVSSCGNQSLGPLAAQSVHVVKLSAGFLTSISIWYFFMAIDHDIIWPKSEGWFLAANRREKKIADSPREVNLVEESLTPTSVCSVRHTAKKGPVVAFRAYRQWRMPPGVPPETMDQDHTTYARGSVPESYWNHLRFRMVSIYKLDGVCIPPKLHQSNQKRKVPSALESFQSQQISSQLNMSTYGKRQSSQTAWGPTKKPRDKAVASWKCNKGGDLHPNSYMLYAKKTALVVK